MKKGLTFAGYAEGLPKVGSKEKTDGGEKPLYVRKHVPWISFKEIPDSCNLRYPLDFPKEFKDLPRVGYPHG